MDDKKYFVTLNRKICSLAVLSLLLIVQYLHKQYLIYYYRIITHFNKYNNILLCKSTRPVSYTHLDVYKRQPYLRFQQPCQSLY